MGCSNTASGRLVHSGTVRGLKVCCWFWVLWNVPFGKGTAKEQELVWLRPFLVLCFIVMAIVNNYKPHISLFPSII